MCRGFSLTHVNLSVVKLNQFGFDEKFAPSHHSNSLSGECHGFEGSLLFIKPMLDMSWTHLNLDKYQFIEDQCVRSIDYESS